jgi:hypothetical protein
VVAKLARLEAQKRVLVPLPWAQLYGIESLSVAEKGWQTMACLYRLGQRLANGAKTLAHRDLEALSSPNEGSVPIFQYGKTGDQLMFQQRLSRTELENPT